MRKRDYDPVIKISKKTFKPENPVNDTNTKILRRNLETLDMRLYDVKISKMLEKFIANLTEN